MKARVTQTDIARVAGVHNTTVSLSLRNSRLIPDPTRMRIRALAEKMGYCPDPALTALVAYRNSCRLKRRAVTLAYITNWETRWGWQDHPTHEKYHIGAQRQAAESGYHLEHFWLGEEGMSQQRLSGMLLHRGISGVLLAAQRAMCDNLSGIDWSRLSGVRIGCCPQVPALNQVTVDQNRVVSLAMRRIRLAGYRRIGLVLPPCWGEPVDHSWSKAYFAEQFPLRASDRLPPLYLQGPQPGPLLTGLGSDRPDEAGAFARWYHEHRPEVVLGVGPVVLARLNQIGLSVPRDVAYVDLLLDHPEGVAGVRENCERVGALAVEMLARQLQLNVFGAPAVATITSVCGVWADGASLPAATRTPVRDMAPEEARVKVDLVA